MDTSAFWDFMYEWELVFLLVVSLSLQLVLVPMGSKRKYSSNNCLRLFLLIAYSSADWIVMVSLGIVIEKYGGGCYDEFSDPIYIIRAFWMPFLLFHLGGSDTITAYSIQDNDLWLRALFRFITNLLLSFYIFMLALNRPKALNYIAIPVFVAGIIKYAQKICALRSASGQRLRDLLVSPPPPFRPNTQNFAFPIKITSTEMDQLNVSNNNDPYFSDLHMLHLAYCFFKRDKRLFVDLDLSSYHLQQSLYYFEKFDSKTAFKVIELELGFIYDFFYTKAFVIHSRWGRVLRLTSVSSLVIAMVAFSCMSDWQDYPLKYVRLTFILFSAALGLEIYSLLLFLHSDWNVISLTRSSYSLPRLIFKLISHCGWSVWKRRWSNSTSQYNIISRCLKEKNDGRYYYRKFLRSISCITKITAANSRCISNDLQTRIFEQLKEKKLEANEANKKLPGWILRKHNCYNQLGWSLKLDFDESILLWHIATDICYHNNSDAASIDSSLLEDSVLLSDFLTDILAQRPWLFPNGMSQIRLSATNDDVVEFLQKKKLVEIASDACKRMLDLELQIPHEEKRRRHSMFFDGCRLAQQLQELRGSERWEIISHVWVELLANISCECEWYEHAKQLRQGGSLLTHVWLLMQHLGYIKQDSFFTMQDQEEEDTELVDEILNSDVVGHMLDIVARVTGLNSNS